MKTSMATQKTIYGAPLSIPRPLTCRLRPTSQITCKATETKETSKWTSALAVSTSLLVASTPAAHAMNEVAEIAAQDNRLGAVAFLFLPAIAWVLFNIGGPASRQLSAMSADKPKPATPRSAPRAAGRASKKAPVAKKPAPKKAPAKKRGLF